MFLYTLICTYMYMYVLILYMYLHSLYIVDVLGHPFGKVPSPKPFDADVEESQVILTDPCNPIGKSLLAGTHSHNGCSMCTCTHCACSCI